MHCHHPCYFAISDYTVFLFFFFRLSGMPRASAQCQISVAEGPRILYAWDGHGNPGSRNCEIMPNACFLMSEAEVHAQMMDFWQSVKGLTIQCWCAERRQFALQLHVAIVSDSLPLHCYWNNCCGLIAVGQTIYNSRARTSSPMSEPPAKSEWPLQGKPSLLLPCACLYILTSTGPALTSVPFWAVSLVVCINILPNAKEYFNPFCSLLCHQQQAEKV